MSRPYPRSLAAALEGLTASLAPASALARTQEVWERVAGPTIATSAKPTGERQGVLTITCSAAVWAQELDLMAPVLLERLNGALGEELLHKLNCRTG